MFHVKRDVWALLLTALGVLLAVEMISFHGHLPQLRDFFVRNPIYNVLVRCDWPLYSAKGEYFVYYAAYWLPPAFVAKWMPGTNPAHFLFLWTLLGLLLSFGLLFIRLRARVLFLLLILLLLETPEDFFHRRIPGLAWRASFDERWALIQYVTDTFHSYAVLYPSWLLQLMQTFNHAVPMMLAASLIWSRLIPMHHMPFVAATAVVCSPIGALGLFVLLLLSMGSRLLKKDCLKRLCCTPSLWCGLVLLLFVGQYYSSAPPDTGVSFAPSLLAKRWEESPLRVGLIFIGSIGAFYLPFCFLMSGKRTIRYARTPIFYAILLLGVFISLVWIGSANNELMFKVSLFIFLFLALLLSGWWKHADRIRRCIFIILLLAYSTCFLNRGRQFLTDWSCEPNVVKKHIQNEWEGHLNHPKQWEYRNFWSPPQEASYLWYTEEGASAKTLLAPAATGVKCSEMGREDQGENHSFQDGKE